MKEILLPTHARKEYERLDEETKIRIKNALKDIAKGIRRDVKKLKGVKGREDLYRLRIGGSKCIKVTQIIHRSKGYDWL